MKRLLIAATVALLIATSAHAAVEDAVYVSAATGSAGYSGLTRMTPVSTITQGLAIAASAGRRQVQVAAGTYSAFTMTDGIDVIGRFDLQFNPVASATASVVAAYAPAYGQYIAVIANGITQTTRLSGFSLQHRSLAPGRNSIGLLIRTSSSGLTIENIRILGGSPVGAAMNGANGSNAPQTPAAAGGAGAAANATASGAKGSNGTTRDGASGQAGSGALAMNSGNPARMGGTAGTLGSQGSGGGGGGGGGGVNLLAIGASGGGGAGGTATPVPGAAGLTGAVHDLLIATQ